jgi:trigger factor
VTVLDLYGRGALRTEIVSQQRSDKDLSRLKAVCNVPQKRVAVCDKMETKGKGARDRSFNVVSGMDFQSSVQDIDEVTKKVVVVVGKDRVVREYESSVAEVGKTARIDGFRPGKVPRQMVERLLGDRIKFDITNKLINEGLRSAFEQHKLNTVGQPQIDLKEMQVAQELEFSATVELLPEPEIKNYLDRSVEVEKKDVTDQDVQAAFDQVVESRAELTPIEGRTEAADGDVVALSVSIKVEDGEFSQPEPFVDQLGLGRLSKQVEKEIVGLATQGSKDIEIVADDEHPVEGLRGKKVAYKITLHGLYAKKLPTVDDEFVKSLSMGVESVAALREKIQTQLKDNAEAETKSRSQGALLELLVKENPFKVPQTLVDEEIREMVARMGLAGKNADPEQIDIGPFRQYFEETAIQRLRTAILVDRIGAQEQIKVEDADTKKMIADIAEKNNVSVEVATKALLDRSRIAGFISEVRRTKVLDLLMGRTKVAFVAAKSEKKASKK